MPQAHPQKPWLLHVLHRVPRAAALLEPVEPRIDACDSDMISFNKLLQICSHVRAEALSKCSETYQRNNTAAVAADENWEWDGAGVPMSWVLSSSHFPVLRFGKYGSFRILELCSPLNVALLIRNVEALKAILEFLALEENGYMRLVMEQRLKTVLHWAAKYERWAEGEIIISWSRRPGKLLHAVRWNNPNSKVVDGANTVAPYKLFDEANGVHEAINVADGANKLVDGANAVHEAIKVVNGVIKLADKANKKSDENIKLVGVKKLSINDGFRQN